MVEQTVSVPCEEAHQANLREEKRLAFDLTRASMFARTSAPEFTKTNQLQQLTMIVQFK